MGLLQMIKRGCSHAPPRILVYGTEGIGKSTLAAQAPKTVFVPTEDGLNEIDCERFPLCQSYSQVLDALTELHRAEHPYHTVAIDSADWLERLVWDHVCQREGAGSIEKVGGGYGKGYTLALDVWRKIVDALAKLHSDRQMAVILLAHAKVERFEDPEAPTYDRYSPRLHKHAAALITEWCDAVLFATRKLRTQSEDAGFNRTRTIAHAIGRDGGERILRCIGGPSCVAKNRYGLPAELPLDWQALVTAMTNKQAEPNTNTNPTAEG